MICLPNTFSFPPFQPFTWNSKFPIQLKEKRIDVYVEKVKSRAEPEPSKKKRKWRKSSSQNEDETLFWFNQTEN